MVRRTGLGFLFFVVSILAGCGGGEVSAPSGAIAPGPEAAPAAKAGSSRRVVLVGFDASSRLVEALRDKTLLGTVVQNPYKMGRLGVETLVDFLEKRPIEPKISTGETMVTPENMEQTEIASLINPPKAEGSGGSASGAKSKKWRIMVIPKGTTHEFWKTIHAGALKGAEELGNVEVVWQGPQKEDERSEQIKLVQNAVAAKVDGLVIAPLDAKALVSPIEEAVSKGIPAVIIDSALESNKIVSYVATDNYNGGVLAARRLGELLKGEGKIILLRYAVGSASTEEREKGFTDTIKKEFPKLTYLSDDQYAGATSDQAQQKSQNLITRFRNQVDGIFCPNESSTLGMLRTLEAAGLVSASR